MTFGQILIFLKQSVLLCAGVALLLSCSQSHLPLSVGAQTAASTATTSGTPPSPAGQVEPSPPPNSSGPVGPAGWQVLSGTKLQSVCPANQFNGINYNFADHCGAVVTAWSGAVADATRNRLIIWGGGHGDYSGNEVYSLNLGAATPTLTRITNPSDFTKNTDACPETNTIDGTPVSRHTYNGLAYLPTQDQLFAYGGARAPCGGPISTATFRLDLSTSLTWHSMDTVNGYNPASSYQYATPICAYDPNSKTVICNSTGTFFQYDPVTNTNTKLSDEYAPYTSTAAVDPKRKRLVLIGADSVGGPGHVKVMDLSAGSAHTLNDWTSTVKGCDTLMNASYPGLDYDPVQDRFVGYPNSGSTVYLFDSDTRTCTAQTFPGGPPDNITTQTTGTFGRFRYLPGMNAYALVVLPTLDAYKLVLPTPGK